MLDEVFKMCFPRRFLFFEFIFLPFFYFPVSIFEISSKMTEKNCFLPILRYERIIYARYCVIMRKKYLRPMKDLFALPCERINYLRSQHSLDIFPGQELAGLCFWLPIYLYIEIKR